MAKWTIQLHKANTLTFLGQLYRNPREALKEDISNAIDGWSDGGSRSASQCRVLIQINRTSIRFESSGYPGMDDKDFKKAMVNIAHSMKTASPVPQIGRLGIGLFAFSQFASRATFYSRKALGHPTYRFRLEKGSDQYEHEVSRKQLALAEPGLTIEFTGLAEDPTTKRAALHPNVLVSALADLFSSYLRDKTLRLQITLGGQTIDVQPPATDLEPIGVGLSDLHVNGDTSMPIGVEFYFNPTGRGQVAIRHTGVSIIRNIGAIDPMWVGFDASVFCSGYLEGSIDANFLSPLPARTEFERDAKWARFRVWLERIESSIAAEVETRKQELELQRIEQVQKDALKLVEAAFNTDLLKDVQLLSGMRRKRASLSKGKRGEPTKRPKPGAIERKQLELGDIRKGLSIRFREAPLKEGRKRHSKWDQGIVLINSANPNYEKFIKEGQSAAQTWYTALLVGKETIAANDHSQESDVFLEKLVAFVCTLQDGKGKLVSPAS